jgi:uncharacterized metal-binding protein
MKLIPQCAKCPVALCESTALGDINKDVLPQGCPIRTTPETVNSAINRYKEDSIKHLYGPATITEKEAYQNVRGVVMAVRPRIKELIEFAKLLSINKIGVAFCAGLRDEALRLTRCLEKHGFTVASVVCKCGAVDKSDLGVDNEYKIGSPDEFESACNPILQAELLNNAETALNVVVGLCIGHDILFTTHSKAPATTLIVKDRLLGHNPVIALYSAYHKPILDSQTRV